MDIEFITPDDGITVQVVGDALALTGAILPEVTIATWTDMERLVAYDWAIREHLHASDSDVERRSKPWFVAQTEELTRILASQLTRYPGERQARLYNEGPQLHLAVRKIIAKAGDGGIIPQLILADLKKGGLLPSRETLARWLSQDEHAGLIEVDGSAVWKATERLRDLLERIKPDEGGQERAKAPEDLSACHQAMLEIMRERGILGSTPRLLMDELQRKGFGPRRETVQRYLLRSSDRGLVEQRSYGSWRATRKLLESMP